MLSIQFYCVVIYYVLNYWLYFMCSALSHYRHIFGRLAFFRPFMYYQNVLSTSRLKLRNWSFYNSLYCHVYKTQSLGLHLSKFKGGHLKCHSENSHLQISLMVQMWLSRTHGDMDRHDSFNHLIVKLPCYRRLFAT